MEIREIVTNEWFLNQRCVPVDSREIMDLVVTDLLTTINHHKDKCLGLAANQIGYRVRVIGVRTDNEFKVMVNPEIIFRGRRTKIELETCLSFPNRKPVQVRRHKKIGVVWFDPIRRQYDGGDYEGLAAQVIQHTIGHLDGALV